MSAITSALYYFCYRFSDPSLYLLHSPLVAFAVLECLIAIWAAESRGYWLWRWLAIVGAVTLMIPARAWEAAWFFGLALPLIVVLLKAPRSLKRRGKNPPLPESLAKTWLRFSLRDLFLLMVAIATPLPLIAELIRHFKPFSPSGWLASSLGMALLAVICFRCVAGPRWKIACAALPVAILLCAVLVRLSVDWAGVRSVLGASGGLLAMHRAMDVGVLSMLELQFAGVLIVVLVLAHAARSPVLSPVRRTAARCALTTAMIVLLGWGGWMYVLVIKPIPPVVKKFAPTMNHYDHIVAIANRVIAINKKNVSIAELNETGQTATAQEMEALYAELLPLLQAANFVPYDPQVHAQQGSRIDIISENTPLRGLCRSLTADAKAAMKKGESSQSIEYLTAITRLGGMLGRGGMVVHALVGRNLEGGGYAELARARAQISNDEQRAVIALLQRLLAEREPAEAIQARDADFMERAYGFPERLNEALSVMGSADWSRYRLKERLDDRDATNLLLQTDLSVRLFQNDHKRLPASLAELVPNYLPQIPIDPYDGTPLKYRSGDNDFVLYSVGYDCYDDGGKFSEWPAYQNARKARWRSRRPRLDVNLDSIIEPEKP
jgi:hypothetical protein